MKNKFKILKQLGLSVLVLGLMRCGEKDVKLSGIELNNVTSELMVDATLDLTVIYTPVDATNKDVAWESSDTEVVTVDEGIVTGVAIGTATITATSQEDPALQASCEITVIPSNGQQFTISGEITSDTRWFGNARYFLSGFVYVKNNATLTIEPGTIIKGVSGTKGALIIERSSKIMAQGTSARPIVFTSDKPKGQRAAGDWGGLVIC